MSNKKRKSNIINKPVDLFDKSQQPIYEMKPLKICGHVYVFGSNFCGQLGIGDAIDESKTPKRVSIGEKICLVAAGGMHNLAVSLSGRLYSWGCNDEGQLGRDSTLDDGYLPKLVEFHEKITIYSATAGDAHSAVLTTCGRVYIWGMFKQTSGILGLIQKNQKECFPKQLTINEKIVKIQSGDNHLTILSENGYVYTLGCNEVGQLGRPIKLFEQHFIATKIQSHLKFCNIFHGQLTSLALDRVGRLWQFGLFQDKIHLKATVIMRNVIDLSAADQHCLILNDYGKIFTLGRFEYGRLGLGKLINDVDKITPINSKTRFKCVSAYGRTSMAISKKGKLFLWGMPFVGDDDLWTPHEICKNGVEYGQLGGQHCVFIAK